MSNERIRIEPPTAELLPAEERLQNVLKAIEERIKVERATLDHVAEKGRYDSVLHQRAFLSGLDIAWSLAKTETLTYRVTNA